MDVTLRIESRAANASPAGLAFVATLIAQENRRVTGSYTIGTAREGQITGTLGGASFFTGGNFAGILTEMTQSGCLAQRRYAGAVTAAGINWLGSQILHQCPEAPFDGLNAVVISVVDSPSLSPAPGQGRSPQAQLESMIAQARIVVSRILSEPWSRSPRHQAPTQRSGAGRETPTAPTGSSPWTLPKVTLRLSHKSHTR